MKLYKDKKVMLFVDKDQVDICLEAGWSKEKPVKKAKKAEVEITEGKEAEEVPKKEKPVKKAEVEITEGKEAEDSY